MRRAALAVLVCALLASSAAADDTGLPPGRLGIVGGMRFFNGAAANDYTFNYVAGFEGGYQPHHFGIFGTVFFGRFDALNAAAFGYRTYIAQVSFAGRWTQRVGGELPVFLSAQGGVDFFRSALPVPAIDGRQIHTGFGAGGSFDWAIGPALFSIAFRYSLINDSAGGLTALLAIGAGS